MAAGHDGEKTEPATAKKLSKARQKGQIAKSREIPSVMVLLSAFSVFYFGGGWMFQQVGDIMRSSMQQLGQSSMGVESVHMLLWDLFQKIVTLLAPLLGVVAIAGVVSNVAQSGFLLTGEPLVPKLSKFNPITGIKNLFSLRSIVEVLKGILKIFIVGGMAYSVLHNEMDQIPALMQLNTPSIMAFMGGVALKLGFYTCMVLIILAALDFWFQKWKHENDMKMTKQEVKDEHKQSEGDPKVKARIRAVQREMAMRRMMEAVPDATVVITNPTHLAIALKFDRSMQAPLVVAKGSNLVAQRIKEIAAEHDVPVIEQKPLARALFKAVEIDRYIPAELYHAVAEILAYVYRLKGLVN